MPMGIVVISCVRPSVQPSMGLGLCIAYKAFGRNVSRWLTLSIHGCLWILLLVCLSVHLSVCSFTAFSGSHYWELAVAITCGCGGYVLPLLATHSSWIWNWPRNRQLTWLICVIINYPHGRRSSTHIGIDACITFIAVGYGTLFPMPYWRLSLLVTNFQDVWMTMIWWKSTSVLFPIMAFKGKSHGSINKMVLASVKKIVVNALFIVGVWWGWGDVGEGWMPGGTALEWYVITAFLTIIWFGNHNTFQLAHNWHYHVIRLWRNI